MLSVLTLWIVFSVNFLALGFVWIYVSRCYPNFESARFWSIGAFLAGLGAAISILREVTAHPMVPLVVAGALLVAACSFIAMGVERFYRQPISWRFHTLLVLMSAASMIFFIWQDSPAMRVIAYSICQSVSIMMTVRLVWQRDVLNPGARLAGVIGMFVIGVNVLRCLTLILRMGGDASMMHFNTLQSVFVLILVFLSMAWNFGFLLMALDRLRAEVADLALFDDLTGVANRRRLLARLDEECARSDRSMQPFALLMIDLDGFKEINDSYGHGAGDACLKSFTDAIQQRLRTGDLLARMGGDEFCVVLPATTLREAAMVARHAIEACRSTTACWHGSRIPLSASIGVAQWRSEMGSSPDGLVAAADQALYAAKRGGKDRFAISEPPTVEVQSALLKSA